MPKETLKDCDKKIIEAAEKSARKLNLSDRQREIFVLLATGDLQKTAAAKIGISPRTVEIHVRHLLEKIGAKTLPHAYAIALIR